MKNNNSNSITMSAPTKISEELQLIAEERAALAELERKTFAADFARSSQCETIIEGQVMYLKHKMIPTKIKENPATRSVVINPNMQRYCSPWIYEDAVYRGIALDVVARELGRVLGSEYTVEFDANLQTLKVSW